MSDTPHPPAADGSRPTLQQLRLQQEQADQEAYETAFLNKKISYKELNLSACKIANFLQSKDIGHNDRIAILSKNHSIFFELQFACSKIGSIMVPLSKMSLLWADKPGNLTCNLKPHRKHVSFIDGALKDH